MEDTRERFLAWAEKEAQLALQEGVPRFESGEVWWAAVGMNIGVEIDGKHKRFSRPVLIFKKMNRLGFLGVPLTSKFHEGDWYVQIDFLGARECAVVGQIKMMSSKRLYSRMGRLSDEDFDAVREGIRQLYME